MHNKKSQMTLFIIIGLVILMIIVAFLIYSNMRADEQTTEIATKAQRTTTELEPVINYVQACLENVAKDGLFLIGKQGGSIFKSQGGMKTDYPDEWEGRAFASIQDGDETYRVTYRILAASASVASSCSATLPDYPVKNDDEKYPRISGEKYDYPYCFGTRRELIPSYLFDSPMRDLKSYLEKKVKEECDVSVFKNFQFEFPGEPEASIESTPTQTHFILDYPITVINPLTGSTTDLKEFRATIRFSLSKLFDFVNDLAEQDVSDPRSNINMGTADFAISTTPLPNKDSLISISSTKFMIDTKPFTFRFARRNRYPALESIDFSIPSGSQVSFDGVNTLTVGATAHELKAVDPDEEEGSLAFKARVYHTNGSYADISSTGLPVFSGENIRISVEDALQEAHRDYQAITVS
jgi:hypothetical protein